MVPGPMYMYASAKEGHNVSHTRRTITFFLRCVCGGPGCRRRASLESLGVLSFDELKVAGSCMHAWICIYAW